MSEENLAKPPTRDELLLECLRALRRVVLTDRQRRVAEVVLEVTMGSGRPCARIPNQECLAALCGKMNKGNVSEAVADLRLMEMIEVEGDEYRFQGNITRWKSLGGGGNGASLRDSVVALQFRVESGPEASALKAINELNGAQVQAELWRNELDDAMRSRDMEAFLAANGVEPAAGRGQGDALAGMPRAQLLEKMRASLAQFPDGEVLESGTFGVTDGSRIGNAVTPLTIPGSQIGNQNEVLESGTSSVSSQIGNGSLKLKSLSTEPLRVKRPLEVPDSGTGFARSIPEKTPEVGPLDAGAPKALSTLSATTEQEFIREMQEHLGMEEMHRHGGFWRMVVRNGLRDVKGNPMLSPLQTLRAVRGALAEYRVAKTQTLIGNKRAWMLDRARWIGMGMLKAIRDGARR